MAIGLSNAFVTLFDAEVKQAYQGKAKLVGAAVKALLDCLVVHAAINKFFVELQDVVNDGGSFTFVAAKDASGVPS